MLNKQCSAIASDASLFARKAMVKPTVVTFFAVEFLHSTLALLPCGTVYKGDLVWTADGDVGHVNGFWTVRGSDHIVVGLSVYTPLGNNRWDTRAAHAKAVDTEVLYDTVTYAPVDSIGNVVRVVPPTRSIL